MTSNAPNSPAFIKEALQYDAESLKNGIDKCQVNIQLFEDAIDKERQTIDRYNQMIVAIELYKQK